MEVRGALDRDPYREGFETEVKGAASIAKAVKKMKKANAALPLLTRKSFWLATLAFFLFLVISSNLL